MPLGWKPGLNLVDLYGFIGWSAYVRTPDVGNVEQDMTGHPKIHHPITEACQLVSLRGHRTFATGHGHLPLTWLSIWKNTLWQWLCKITMANHHAIHGKIQYKLPFSIAMFTRGYMDSFAFTAKFWGQRTSLLGLLEPERQLLSAEWKTLLEF